MKRSFNLSYPLPCLNTCPLDPVTTHSFSEQWWSQIIPYARSHHSHYNTNRWGQDSWLFRIDWRKGTELKVCLIMIWTEHPREDISRDRITSGSDPRIWSTQPKRNEWNQNFNLSSRKSWRQDRKPNVENSTLPITAYSDRSSNPQIKITFSINLSMTNRERRLVLVEGHN